MNSWLKAGPPLHDQLVAPMSPEAFEEYQRSRLPADTTLLTRACRRRYREAAALLEVRPPGIERMDRLDWDEGLQPWLAYRAIQVFQHRCARSLFTSQLELWPSPTSGADARWSAYLCNKLIPALLERDDFVRGLLRCVGLLPAASQLDWQGATETYAREFPMPWVAEAEGIGEP